MALSFDTQEFVKNLTAPTLVVDRNNSASEVNWDTNEQKERMKKGETVYSSVDPFKRFLDNLFGESKTEKYSKDVVRDDLDLDNFEALDRTGKKYEDFGNFKIKFYKTITDKNGKEQVVDEKDLTAFTPKTESASSNNSGNYSRITDDYVSKGDNVGVKSRIYGGVDGESEYNGEEFINLLKKYKDAGYSFVIDSELERDENTGKYYGERYNPSGKSKKDYYDTDYVPTGSVKITEDSTDPHLSNFWTNSYLSEIKRTNPELRKDFIKNLRGYYGNKYDS